MNPELLNTAEIAMIRSLGEQVSDQSKPGRIKAKAQNLMKESDKHLSALGKISDCGIKRIERHLTEFFKLTGWAGSQKNVVTIISFCLELVENSSFKYSNKIVDLLNDMFDYHERAGRVKESCLWPGGLAYEKWAEISHK